MNGLTYKTLTVEDKRRLDDAVLHATIFQQDDPEDDRSSVYLIFERLNTGGTPLAPQEIRACVYRGAFNELLSELAGNGSWREIYGPASSRAKDQELILRFFALYYSSDEYQPPLKGFLNRFMEKYRLIAATEAGEFRSLFVKTIAVASGALTRSAFRPERNLNAAVAEAFLVGLARRLKQGELRDAAGLRAAAEDLLKNRQFLDAVTSSTTKTQSIATRLELATEAFARIQ